MLMLLVSMVLYILKVRPGVVVSGHVACAAGVPFGVAVNVIGDGHDAGEKHKVMVLQAKS